MFGTLIGPDFIFYVIVLPISLVLHEYAHARTADWFGDRTARMNGRLTLNPLVHLDPIGLLMILFGPVGWAKPIPVNPSNFRRPRLSTLVTAAAGPVTNLLIASAAMILLRLMQPSQVFFTGVGGFLFQLMQFFAWLNVALFIFNLIPVPPLDGSRILGAVLPVRVLVYYRQWERFGPFLLLLLVIIPPLRMHVLAPLLNSTWSLFLSVFS